MNRAPIVFGRKQLRLGRRPHGKLGPLESNAPPYRGPVYQPTPQEEPDCSSRYRVALKHHSANIDRVGHFAAASDRMGPRPPQYNQPRASSFK